MIDTENISTEELEIFGLSSYEARAYISLLTGVKIAKEIVKESNIPTGRVYDILGSLEDKGLIERQDSRPKKYSAKPPKVALKNLITKKEEDFQSLKEKAPILEKKLSQLKRPNASEELFWSIALFSEDNAIARLVEKIKEAETELLMCADMSCYSTDSTLEFLEPDRIVNSLLDRGVDIKILIGGFNSKNLSKINTSAMKDFIPLISKMNIRITEINVYNFDIIDEEKIILKIANPINPSENLAMLYFWQKKLGSELRDKFFELWNNAKELNFIIK
ncbi:MAG: TrmB family transcriptional regulator [Candidatus Lokiarchaeota archaeon]|nr:TrmB family transcriptional regulator [Candidatus Lokiarchaeota archaeon]